MKQFLNLALSFIFLTTQFTPYLHAQQARRPIKFQNTKTIEEILAEESQKFIIQRDALTNPAEDRLQAVYERQSNIVRAQFKTDRLMNEIEKALEKDDAQDFYNKVNSLNAILLEYLESSIIEIRLIGALSLLEQLREGVITRQHAQQAFARFQSIVEKAHKCSGPYCDLLSASAFGLTFKNYLYDDDPQNFPLSGNELRVLRPSDEEMIKRVNTVKKLAYIDFESKESNALMAKGTITALAAFGDIKAVEEAAHQIITSINGYQKSKIDAKNDLAQIAVLDTLLELGPQTKHILRKYAYDVHTRTSHAYANINMAYTYPAGKERELVDKNLEFYYCHYMSGLDSQQDMHFKQKLAYAYGRGQSLSYITPAGSQKCLIVVPDRPDPRKVAKEWTNIVVVEAAFSFAFLGFGTAFRAIKHGVRAAKHFTKVKVLAKARKIKLAKFYKSGKGPSSAGKVFAKASKAPAPKATTMGNPSTKPPLKPKKIEIPDAQNLTHANAAKTNAEIRMDSKNLVGSPTQVTVVSRKPFRNPITKRYPSGLKDDKSLVDKWYEYHQSGYFQPRDQIEAITAMNPKKMNNTIEYILPLTMKESEKIILTPLRTQRMLPNYMYSKHLIPSTKPLPAGYYKNKFNKNIERFLDITKDEASFTARRAELNDIVLSMKDYNFTQGFSFTNDSYMSAGLRKKWLSIVKEAEHNNLANYQKVMAKWKAPVKTGDNTLVTLEDFFTQKRKTQFSFLGLSTPEFFLNSPKWVSLENVRRNRAASIFSSSMKKSTNFLDKIQNKFYLGDRKKYLTLDEFGDVMVREYKRTNIAQQNAVKMAEQTADIVMPSSTKVRINNFEIPGGACQSLGKEFSRIKPGYDGTSLIDRFSAHTQQNVKAVVFTKDFKPQIVRLKQVSHIKDAKPIDLDITRASTMVADGLDHTRDLLTVKQAELALFKIPDLRATIHPHYRITTLPDDLTGGGMGAYISLFKKDFYPVKTIKRLRFKGLKPYVTQEHFIRKEVPALAGSIHRDRLTFLEQVQSNIIK